jgi:hypothetical protein
MYGGLARVTKQQVEEVGFVVDPQARDRSTLGRRRVQPREHDAFTTGMGNVFDPTRWLDE